MELSVVMSLSATFSALSDPTRRDVVSRLKHGEATVSHLASGHPMSLPAFSKHIGVLVDAGLVERRKVGRTMVCSLASARLEDAEAWISDLRTFWSAGLERLDDLLAADPAPEDHDRDPEQER